MSWKESEILSIGAGLLLGLFGWIMLAGSILTREEATDAVGQVALGVLLGVIPILLGTFLIVRPIRKRKRRQQENLERQILELAETHGGILVPALVARGTDLTLAESKALLNDLHLNGYCGSELQDGHLVYRFSAPST